MPDMPVTTTLLRPDRGGLTFDSEGTEGGKLHSRTLHVHGSNSGLTIGRGYDMATKSASQITADLAAAGVDPAAAKTLSLAASLRGDNAKKFIKDNGIESFEISELTQKKLFEATYAAEEQSVRSVCQRAAKKFGEFEWEKLHPAIQELVVDLKYRGDYTPQSREVIQLLIVENDLEGLAEVMADQKNWAGVPVDRFTRRKAFMEAAVKENK